MRPIVTDGVARSVWLSVTIVSSVKTAELIEMPFGVWTRLGQRKHVLYGGAYQRNLANAIEPSMCGGDAVFLSNYFDHLLVHGQVTIIFVVSVCLSLCLFVYLFVCLCRVFLSRV